MTLCQNRISMDLSNIASIVTSFPAACPLYGKISSDILDLSVLHESYAWIPGENDIRPSSDTLVLKRSRLAMIESEWASFCDYIRVTVFGLLKTKDSSGRYVSIGDDSNIPSHTRVFAPNEFPYNVPKHWVLWYGPNNVIRDDDEITAHIREALSMHPTLKDRQFAWYVNPKMTVPEYFHVQVFIS